VVFPYVAITVLIAIERRVAELTPFRGRQMAFYVGVVRRVDVELLIAIFTTVSHLDYLWFFILIEIRIKI
jgi:hypothetical protein